MGGDRPYTPAELRQQEKDQHDPAWLAWLAAMPDALAEFLTTDVLDMPADPWTLDGLRHAEQASLAFFPTWDSVDEPSKQGRADRTSRYIGEVFRRNFGGKWRNVPELFGGEYEGFTPAVDEPYSEIYLDVVTILTATLDRRTGREWEFLFDHSQKSYAAWRSAGSLPLSEWVALRDKA